MRITIETDDQKSATPDVQPLSNSAQPTTIDGGAPSEMASQTSAEAVISPSQPAGTSAGPPPDWLVEALQNTKPSTASSSLAPITDQDAGAAPDNGN